MPMVLGIRCFRMTRRAGAPRDWAAMTYSELFSWRITPRMARAVLHQEVTHSATSRLGTLLSSTIMTMMTTSR